jgi:tetratricopeptide (TPR) repeat protein
VLQKDPDNTQALNDLAWILAVEHREYAKALELADRGLKFAPENRHLRDTRGVILSNMPDRLKEARQEFSKCVELSPPDSSARAKSLLQLGRTCVSLNDPTEAKRSFEQALRIDEKNRVFSEKERSEIKSFLGE